MCMSLHFTQTNIWHTANGQGIWFLVTLTWTNHCDQDMHSCSPFVSCNSFNKVSRLILIEKRVLDALVYAAVVHDIV